MSLRLRSSRFAASCLAVLVASAALAGAVLAAPAGAATDQLASVTVTGALDEKPTIAVEKPVSVKSSIAKVVSKGTGDKAMKGSTVTLDYVIVNGRTGQELSTTYGSSPRTISLDVSQAPPDIVDNLVGERVGSRVMIAVAPVKGATGTPPAGTKKTDTLLFVADLHSAHQPLKRAAGTAVAPVDGLPTVKLAKNGSPTITMPKTDAPSTLVVQPLIKGDGAVVQAGQTITVNYVGAIWDGGKVFDSSWKSGSPLPTVIGAGQVIPGWDQGLVGQTVGSQVLLAIPPDLGYGSAGNTQAGIKGTDTLVFVVDILDAS